MVTTIMKLSHEIKRHLFLGRSYEEHSVLRSRDKNKKTSLKLSIQQTKIMASGPITSWQIDGERMETVTDFIFLGSKITGDGDCSHEIKRCLLLGRRAMTNLAAKLFQSCPTLCDPTDDSPPGCSVHGIFQARVLEWGAIAFSVTNLDRILKSRDITLPTVVCIVKSYGFSSSHTEM